jgi:hypothetical protein
MWTTPKRQSRPENQTLYLLFNQESVALYRNRTVDSIRSHHADARLSAWNRLKKTPVSLNSNDKLEAYPTLHPQSTSVTQRR